MDSYDFDSVKEEKAKAMKRYNWLRAPAKVFHFLELLIALLFLAWTFERLPFAVKISGDFVLKLCGVIASPLFVFLVCNVIIAILIAKSGIFSTVNNADPKLYEEITKNVEEDRSKLESQEEDEDRDKEIISEVKKCSRTREEMERPSESDSEVDNPGVYRRSKSEKLAVKKKEEKAKKELRRSASKKCRKNENIDDELLPEDELSNEEFQRTIEDFINKQLRFRREESPSIVLQRYA
ncbi:hypothetical protein Gotur_020069 [Gossypium turneri]